jgi:phosphoenolpyruvate phosphomutase
MKKTQQFRKMLQPGATNFLMEAHNGLSAKIVEETGFKGIWASGLSISAALGVRDNNEASWTQVLEVVEFMSDATSIPILIDADTGYGNFNNMRRLVRKLEQRDIAAVCIEDKLFPKTNSFIQGDQQPLADLDEFAGKIKAVKDEQQDPDFSVVARLEGFIAGWGLEEMLRRAHAYAEAGADALLIHSKKSTPDQILAFAQAWDKPCPLVIVPTMYYSTPAQVFRDAGIRLVIWANHNVRTSINAMQETCRTIYEEESVRNVEDEVVPVKEVFRLQNAQELLEAEDRYLPSRTESTQAIILAASQGRELGDLTTHTPKTMIPVGGSPLLHKLVAKFRHAHIKDITVVRGFAKDTVHAPDVHFVDNDRFADTGELLSLAQAEDRIKGELVISFGDILFRQHILNQLLEETGDIVLAVDAAWKERPGRDRCRDFISASQPYSLKYNEAEVLLKATAPSLAEEEINGEWIGLLKCSTKGSKLMSTALHQLRQNPDFETLRFENLLQAMMAAGIKVHVCYITGHWLDLDNIEDLALAQSF